MCWKLWGGGKEAGRFSDAFSAKGAFWSHYINVCDHLTRQEINFKNSNRLTLCKNAGPPPSARPLPFSLQTLTFHMINITWQVSIFLTAVRKHKQAPTPHPRFNRWGIMSSPNSFLICTWNIFSPPPSSISDKYHPLHFTFSKIIGNWERKVSSH